MVILLLLVRICAYLDSIQVGICSLAEVLVGCGIARNAKRTLSVLGLLEVELRLKKHVCVVLLQHVRDEVALRSRLLRLAQLERAEAPSHGLCHLCLNVQVCHFGICVHMILYICCIRRLVHRGARREQER